LSLRSSRKVDGSPERDSQPYSWSKCHLLTQSLPLRTDTRYDLEETPAAELVELLSGEIEPSDFKLLLSSPRLTAVVRDVMTVRGVSVRSGRDVRIRDAVAEVLYEDEVLAQIKAHVVDRPQTGLTASAPDPHATPRRSGYRHFLESNLTSREREAEAKRSQQVSHRFPEEVKYTGAPDADLSKVLGKMRDCITDLSLSPTESRKYAHNLFTDDAKRFFDDDQDIKAAATLDRVTELVSERFISSTARTSAEAYLEGLQIARLMKEDRKSPRDALTFICCKIVTKILFAPHPWLAISSSSVPCSRRIGRRNPVRISTRMRR
jgi:hypothetical protein